MHGVEPWKRTVDVAVSLVGLVLSAPLVGLAALLVKTTSPGSVLVSQERIGLNRRIGDRRNGNHSGSALERRLKNDRRASARHGRPFNLYKFRSMKEDAENGQPVLAVDNDPRVTPVGRILRKSRIDEIPQFVNVLRGDMSIVGPRPEREYFYGQMEHDVPGFTFRLRTKPGITGLAQVSQGYANTPKGMQVKLQHDLEYIRNVRPVHRRQDPRQDYLRRAHGKRRVLRGAREPLLFEPSRQPRVESAETVQGKGMCLVSGMSLALLRAYTPRGLVDVKNDAAHARTSEGRS